MSTARLPTRCRGNVRPICQSHRIGRPALFRCGGYQQVPRHDSGAGSLTTRHPKLSLVRPAASEVSTVTRCRPGRSVPVKNTRRCGMARQAPWSILNFWTTGPSAEL